MLIALVAGISMILRAGASLEAPKDLAGNWQLDPQTPGALRSMKVVQSGQFFTVHLDSARKLDLKLVETPPKNADDDAPRRYVLANEQWSLQLERRGGDDEFELTLIGPSGPSRYSAVRVERTYPAPALPVPAEATADAHR
jgi:hypothetical protein